MNVFHGVVGVWVVEDERFLDLLVMMRELLDLWPVSLNGGLVRLQFLDLLLKSAVHFKRDADDFFCFLLNPRADRVCLLRELDSQLVVVLLLGQFELERAVASRNVVDDRVPSAFDGVGADGGVGIDSELDAVLKKKLLPAERPESFLDDQVECIWFKKGLEKRFSICTNSFTEQI